MAKQLIAAIDGVMVKVGGEYRTLYKDGAVPDGADADHVKVLVDRGLLVDAPAEPDAEDAKPAKAAAKADPPAA